MRDKIFIIVFMVIICGLPSIILVRPPKEVSSIENRELATLDSLKNKKILNNDFQNNLENVLADQMILAQTLKLYYNFWAKGDFYENC